MTIPSSDIPREDDVGSTLEQFRLALRSELGRERLGIDIDDEEARSIAADAEQSARWYDVWRTTLRDDRRSGAERTVPARFEQLREQKHDWQRHLPVRFNAPPGSRVPSQDWILRHIGLEMSDAWRPPEAPRDDPPGWVWWIPQEPAWTAWIQMHNPRRERVRGWGVALGVFTGLAITLPFAGWALGALLATPCALGSGIGLITAVSSLRHFRRDPLGELRDNHTQVAERLNYGAAVGDGHHVDFDDFVDLADLFDGE